MWQLNLLEAFLLLSIKDYYGDNFGETDEVKHFVVCWSHLWWQSSVPSWSRIVLGCQWRPLWWWDSPGRDASATLPSHPPNTARSRPWSAGRKSRCTRYRQSDCKKDKRCRPIFFYKTSFFSRKGIQRLLQKHGEKKLFRLLLWTQLTQSYCHKK